MKELQFTAYSLLKPRKTDRVAKTWTSKKRSKQKQSLIVPGVLLGPIFVDQTKRSFWQLSHRTGFYFVQGFIVMTIIFINSLALLRSVITTGVNGLLRFFAFNKKVQPYERYNKCYTIVGVQCLFFFYLGNSDPRWQEICFLDFRLAWEVDFNNLEKVAGNFNIDKLKEIFGICSIFATFWRTFGPVLMISYICMELKHSEP